MTVDLANEALVVGAAVFAALANWLLGSRRSLGWLAVSVGNALWLWYGLRNSSPAIVAEGTTFQLIAARGWIRWRRETGGACEG